MGLFSCALKLVVFMGVMIDTGIAISMVVGKKYSCSISIRCACGGDLDSLPDLYVEVRYQELTGGIPNGSVKLIAKTEENIVTVNNPNAVWNNLFNVTYKGEGTQEIFVKVYDWDPETRNEFLGETEWFGISQWPPVTTYSISSGEGGQIAPCPPPPKNPFLSCNGKRGNVGYSCSPVWN